MAERVKVPETVITPTTIQPLVAWAKKLAYFTIGYNLLEGIVSIALGVKEESFALAGFGFDSLIEVGSALLVVWRLKSDFDKESVLSVKAERRATFGIGVLFLLLAIIGAGAAIVRLVRQEFPDSTVPGLIVSLVSLSFMFFLWRSKLRVARQLDSKTLAADASCSLACIKLSFVLLAGSLIFLLLPTLWWVDSVATLIISAFVAREGWETVESSRKEDFQGGCGCH